MNSRSNIAKADSGKKQVFTHLGHTVQRAESEKVKMG